MKITVLKCNGQADQPIAEKDNFRLRICLLAGAVLASILIFPIVSWADAESQNLRSSTLRQFDFLITRVNNSESFDPPSQTIVNKISENLKTLSSYQIGSIKKREFKLVSERLYTAVEDWKSGQLQDARHHLLKSRALLASFSF